jgi:uncharacterized protein YdeI (YjbR/CyaY-like superfamily)
MEPTYFAKPALWRKWLEKNHAKAEELWVGFRKVGSGEPSVTWPQAVDEALCFGWIDGLRKSIDATRYKIRFTPRKAKSIWSAVNLKKVAELVRQGLMRAKGMEAFEKRDPKRAQKYSFEQKTEVALDAVFEKKFQGDAKAWSFFSAQPPSYRKAATWWVISAKQEETRLRRLGTLIADSQAGMRLAHLVSPGASRTGKKGTGKTKLPK